MMDILVGQSAERLRMDYNQYLEFAGEAQIVEWVNGEVIVHVPPLHRHQVLVSFLNQLLSAFVQFFELGAIVVAPFEVKLWPDGPAREPDLFFVSPHQMGQLSEQRFAGGPALVVEIISAGSVTIDRVDKFQEYQQAGVREYWLIDSRPHQQQADFFVADEDGRFQPVPLDEDGRFFSTVLPHFWLDVAWLAQDTLPNPQLALAEIMLTIDNLPADARQTFRALRDLLHKQS